MNRRPINARWALAAALPLLTVAACSGSDSDDGSRSLTLAHSYTLDQPQNRCGAEIIAEEIDNADVGLSVEIFGDSQLGGDADRISSVASGDVDIDIQGSSALGAVYEPVSVLDAAYVFDDADHLARYMESDASQDLIDGFAEEADVQVLGAWSAGSRQFTADSAIRSPQDLDGLRVRFPNSPQFLMNARALGASPTEVAYEELYLALQQGTVDGQENPITNIDALNLAEVQDFISLTSHQLNTNLVVMGPVWDELDEAQQDALTAAVEVAVTEVTSCVEESEAETLEGWESGSQVEVVDDVDTDAFRESAEAYLQENLEGAQLDVYEAVRGTA